MCRYLISYVYSTRDTVSHVEANRYYCTTYSAPLHPYLCCFPLCLCLEIYLSGRSVHLISFWANIPGDWSRGARFNMKLRVFTSNPSSHRLMTYDVNIWNPCIFLAPQGAWGGAGQGRGRGALPIGAVLQVLPGQRAAEGPGAFFWDWGAFQQGTGASNMAATGKVVKKRGNFGKGSTFLMRTSPTHGGFNWHVTSPEGKQLMGKHSKSGFKHCLQSHPKTWMVSRPQKWVLVQR